MLTTRLLVQPQQLARKIVVKRVTSFMLTIVTNPKNISICQYNEKKSSEEESRSKSQNVIWTKSQQTGQYQM